MRIRGGNSNRYQVRLLAVALLSVLGFVAAGCGGGSSASSAPQGSVADMQHSTGSGAVKTGNIKGLGVVLVNPAGRTLYVFMKDAHRHVTCTGQCASFWPPLKWKSAGQPKAGGVVKASLLGLDRDPGGGGKVVTYNHWPLYTYAGDSAAGQAKGWNQNLNGGKWYVISASGKVVEHKTSSGGGGTTTTGVSGWG